MTTRPWLLFDVEGTITSLAFVKDELFPYAKREVGVFLRSDVMDARPEVVSLVTRLAAATGTTPTDTDELARRLVVWMDEDRKDPDLKTLQGLIWEHGYRSGLLRGHLYPDVVPFWRARRHMGAGLAIYSSGSVHAQSLLLRYSVEGDVSALIDRHFDTEVGRKVESVSYARIVQELGAGPERICFFSDAIAELDAAREAGLGTCRTRRPGVPRLPHGHPEVESFGDVSEGSQDQTA